MTQATVSRDIRELKLTKIQADGGRQRYVVLEGPKGTSAAKFIRVYRMALCPWIWPRTFW